MIANNLRTALGTRGTQTLSSIAKRSSSSSQNSSGLCSLVGVFLQRFLGVCTTMVCAGSVIRGIRIRQPTFGSKKVLKPVPIMIQIRERNRAVLRMCNVFSRIIFMITQRLSFLHVSRFGFTSGDQVKELIIYFRAM
jgi:hypothetical protein